MGDKLFLFGGIDLLLGRQLPDGSRNVNVFAGFLINKEKEKQQATLPIS
jgi:hypothetical protein